MESGVPDLRPLLKQYFGFASFRPLQEEIIRDALAGKDVFALLPTGGGKSLCFQLPAMAQTGLTVVVSPLIALMKDQVDALQASGVPATFLNSSLAAGESRARLRGLHNGQYRLLYAAPERLMLSGVMSDLQRWNVNLLAVDEAHCISEWGHDFRPEYRQLANLRQIFPAVPMMALTATATERVRQDIVTLLKLREPSCYVASFNRPNLTYRVFAKNKPYEQVLEFLRARPRESGIVYCQSRKSTESVAERLSEDGVKARPYHAGLTPTERTEHQELFLRDEVRVICATIAFGMGINKPNVRFVLHYDLPKNIEGYYQETGRAGRDGLPSECVLLFSAGDVVKQTQFIEEKPEPAGADRSPARSCGRWSTTPNAPPAGGANCWDTSARTQPGPTAEAAIIASRRARPSTAPWRRRSSSPACTASASRARFGVGLNQVIEVLTGADTEKIRRWGHEQPFHLRHRHGAHPARMGRDRARAGPPRPLAPDFGEVQRAGTDP